MRKIILLTTLLLALGGTLSAQRPERTERSDRPERTERGDHPRKGGERARDSVANNKPKYKSGQAPLNISGTFGTAITNAWNSTGNGKAAPFSMISYANLTFNVYEWKIPVIVNMSNISVAQFSFNAPTFRVGVTPTWRNLKLHFGHSSMNVSKYTFANLSFRGAGMEYQNNWFRVAGFYGTLQRATRYDVFDNRNSIQHLADSLLGLNYSRSYMPVFRRDAVAGRIGFGSRKNYVDLSFFRAKDDLNSLPETWTWNNDTNRFYRDSLVQARENLAIGLTARFKPAKWLSFAANGGASVYTADQTAPAVTLDNLSSLGADKSDVAKYSSIYDKLLKVYTPRFNTTIRFAGDASMGFQFRPFSANFSYRFVQAGYTSLGSNTFSQNVQAIGANINSRMFKGRSVLGASGYVQRNNLDKTQKSTNQVGSYSLNWRNNITDNFAITLNYNAVKQDQMDGTQEISEEKRINQLAHTVMLTPAYSFYGFNDHTVSLNLTYLQNMNLNDKMVESLTNVINTTTLTGGAGYEIYFRSKYTRFNANYDYSLSESKYNKYKSHGLSLGVRYSLLNKKDIAVSAMANATLSYNIAIDTAQSDRLIDSVLDEVVLRNGRTKTNVYHRYRTDVFSVSGRIGGTFTYKQWHDLSVYLSVSNYSDNVIIGQHISTDIDLRLNINYTYSFARRVIRRKTPKLY